MSKNLNKIVILSALITCISMQHAIPIHAIPIEKISLIKQNYTNALGPEDMKQSLKETGSNMLLLDIYANTIIQQPLIILGPIPFEDKDALVTRIHQHQNQAIRNAYHWTRNLKTQIIKTNQLTLDYQNKFQNYYQVMSDSLEIKDKKIFKEGVKNLIQTLSKNKEKITTVIQNLNAFQTKLFMDNQGFNEDAQKLEVNLIGQDAMIPQIIKEMDILNTVLQDHWKKLTYSGVGLGFAILGGIIVIAIGVTTIVMTGGIALPVVSVLGTGLAMSIAGSIAAGHALTNNLSAIRNINEKIRILMGQKNTAQQASIAIKTATNQINTMAQTISLAIISLTQLKNKWAIMEGRYNSLLSDIDDLSIQSLKEELEIARTGWYELYKLAEQMKLDITQATTR